MKTTKHLASLLAPVLLLTACGGGGGGGSGPVPPPPAVQTPQDPLPITASNANGVIALDTRFTEVVVDLSALLLESIVATAESGQTMITHPCDRGSVTVTLDDTNGNGLPGTNEGASVTATDCEDFDLRYIMSGTADVDFRSFVLDANTAAKTKMRATITSPMQFSDGGTEISFTGEMEIDALYDTVIQSLRFYQRFGDEIALRTVDTVGDNIDTYSGYEVTRGISGVGELAKTIALEVESETLNGTVTCSTPTRLTAVLGVHPDNPELPDAGQLRCSGASNSAARADSMGDGVVDVVVDPEGDGSYVDAGIIAGGTGEWSDFFDPSLFALTFSVPGTIPPQTVVPIASTSAAYSVNDIAKSPSNNNLYISDDAGIHILDAASLALINTVTVTDRPGPIAVADDGARLWFGLQDTAEIQSVTLPNLNLGPRISLGGTRRARQMRVAPGDAMSVVVSMTNNTEMIAYSNGVALPATIDSPSAPVTFEFLDASRIVGLNPAAADHPAAAVTYGAGGLTLDVTRSQFDIQANTAVALAGLIGLDAVNPALVTSSGRIFDAIEGTIFGRLKLNQTEPSENRDGVAVNANTGHIFVFNSSSGLLESYEETLELRGAYRLPVTGGFVRMLDAGGRMILATNAEIHAVDKTLLTNNRNNSPCQPFDLTNQIIFGFFIQIDCGVFDVVYSQSQAVLYALLPSYSGINGNSIARIDAATGEILSRVYVGSEPERMVVTPDETRAYITLGESNRIAVVSLAGGTEVLEGYINLEPYNLNVPQFAEALAVSPADNDVLLVGADARVSVYDDGVRLPNVVAGAAIGNPRDLFFVDGNNAIAQVPTGTISRLSVSANGVTLGTQTAGAASAGSLKLQEGKIYDRDGRVLNASNLSLIGACSIGPAMTGLLVEPSEVSDLIYYLDQSVDSVMTTCRESTTIDPIRTATIPAFGDVGGMPQALEEMGDNRLALTAGDIILLFEADAL